MYLFIYLFICYNVMPEEGISFQVSTLVILKAVVRPQTDILNHFPTVQFSLMLPMWRAAKAYRPAAA
jgi:hypothetical protein